MTGLWFIPLAEGYGDPCSGSVVLKLYEQVYACQLLCLYSGGSHNVPHSTSENSQGHPSMFPTASRLFQVSPFLGLQKVSHIPRFSCPPGWRKRPPHDLGKVGSHISVGWQRPLGSKLSQSPRPVSQAVGQDPQWVTAQFLVGCQTGLESVWAKCIWVKPL